MRHASLPNARAGTPAQVCSSRHVRQDDGAHPDRRRRADRQPLPHRGVHADICRFAESCTPPPSATPAASVAKSSSTSSCVIVQLGMMTTWSTDRGIRGDDDAVEQDAPAPDAARAADARRPRDERREALVGRRRTRRSRRTSRAGRRWGRRRRAALLALARRVRDRADDRDAGDLASRAARRRRRGCRRRRCMPAASTSRASPLAPTSSSPLAHADAPPGARSTAITRS